MANNRHYKERKNIYTILVFNNIEGHHIIGGSRLVGWYESKEDAFEDVRINNCDMWEFCYNYAIIEEIEEGLYRPATNDKRWWFKYNREKDGYVPMEEPKEMHPFVGFTIG